MYEAHFQLREKPFSILPNPKFLYLGARHSMAYSMLEYGIVDNAGFTVITGEIGSGKTSLVRKLVNEISPNVSMALISNTSDQTGRLLDWIMMGFDQPFEGRSYPRLHQEFREFLIRQREEGRRSVIIIDEAQNLDTARLEELRMLSNINLEEMLLQIVIVGQPELRGVLMKPNMKQFAQRISSDFSLLPLAASEAVPYFAHRLNVAGGSPRLFTRSAAKLIHQRAGGVPRVMNVVADRCLLYAFAERKDVVGQRIVNKVLNDINTYGSFITLAEGTGSPPVKDS
jgi:general secretion pathway protein A